MLSILQLVVKEQIEAIIRLQGHPLARSFMVGAIIQLNLMQILFLQVSLLLFIFLQLYYYPQIFSHQLENIKFLSGLNLLICFCRVIQKFL